MAAAAAAPPIFAYVYDQGRIYKLQILPAYGSQIELLGKTKDTFKHYISPIRSLACAGNVDESYITSRFTPSNILIAIGPEKEKDGIGGRKIIDIDPFGFVIGKHLARDLYIDVICSTLNGNNLLKYVTDLAQTKGCLSVTLNSLPSVLTYYPKYGFKFRKDCGPPDVVYEGSALQTKAGTLGRDKLPKTSKQAYNIAEYVDFMRALHAADLNKKKDGLCGKGRAITSNDIKGAECGTDGYTMTKCFAEGLGGGGRRKTHARRRKNRQTRRKNDRRF
jgi:hypothetical protein